MPEEGGYGFVPSSQVGVARTHRVPDTMTCDPRDLCFITELSIKPIQHGVRERPTSATWKQSLAWDVQHVLSELECEGLWYDLDAGFLVRPGSNLTPRL